jgi:hypothetical protein
MKLKALVSIGINHEDILPGTIFELTDQDDIERLVRLKAVEVREEAAVIPVPTMPVPPVESGVSEILMHLYRNYQICLQSQNYRLFRQFPR